MIVTFCYLVGVSCRIFYSIVSYLYAGCWGISRKHVRTKVTPDFHLAYSKNGGNLGSESK